MSNVCSISEVVILFLRHLPTHYSGDRFFFFFFCRSQTPGLRNRRSKAYWCKGSVPPNHEKHNHAHRGRHFEVGGRVTTRTWDQTRLIKHTANPSVPPPAIGNWGHASAWLKLKAARLSRFPQGMQQVAALTEEKATFPYSVRLSPYTPVERAAGATCSPAL